MRELVITAHLRCGEVQAALLIRQLRKLERTARRAGIEVTRWDIKQVDPK